MTAIRRGVTRRDFLKAAVATGAVAATAGSLSGCQQQAAYSPLPGKWDKEADVVIVGAGGTGLAAAIEAMDAGAKVILLDKAAKAGGTTSLSGGVIQASGTSFQKAAGVENDNPENHFKYWMQASEGIADPNLVKVMADNAQANIEWLVAHGVNYVSVYGVDPIPYITDPALMVARIHVPAGQGDTAKPGTGAVHVAALLDVVQKKGAELLFETPAAALIRDPEKGVVGVRAQSGGKDLFVKARRAVILATGSFDHNKEMARAFSPQQLWALDTGVCLCAPESTGDGIKMGMEIGADLAGMGGTIGYIGTSVGVSPDMPGIWVNKYGQRFCNEAGHYAFVMRAVFDQEEHIAWAIFDENVKKLGGKAIGGLFGAMSDDLSKEIAEGKVKTGATIQELATALGVNGEMLEATVAMWNRDAGAGKDTLFNKKKELLKPLAQGPFYGIRVTEANLGSIGGLKINAQAQVVDVFGQVIPRLYAGGMVAGGFIGPYYPGSGTAVNSTVCFGRIAGKNAASEKAWA